MKALILCGGRGTRLLPVTKNMPKHLLPVANKPILFYLLEQIRDAGITDTGIVICPETGDITKRAVGDGSRWGIDITCIEQTKPLGLAHAVIMSKDFLKDENFLMLLGDNLINCNCEELIERFDTEKADAVIALKEVQNPCQFGVAEVNGSGEIIRLTEKPQEPKSRLAVAGWYVFTSEIHRAIGSISPSLRGELEITDAIQNLVETGKKVTGHSLGDWWFDIGTQEGYLKANATVLEKCVQESIKGNLDETSRAIGKVEIGQGTEVINSVIRGPVSIGEDCRIKGSRIGPYASIGDRVIIENSAIENSVILEGCRICKTEPVRNSVIGRNTQVITKGKTCGDIELFLGDDDSIEL